jgi:tRNA dimethylallyltransferase
VSAPRVIAVVGATATGKTDLGEALAEVLDGEVICADSRQVYRELEIGTGKPAPAERAARPHHLFDALGLDERASAGWYGRVAAEARRAARARGRLPILVGGSGLYLRAARRGLAAEPPHDPAFRARLRAELATHGAEALHARLAAVDPITAARLAPRDRQRVGRALEVWEASGRPLSWWQAQPPPAAEAERWTVLEVTLSPAATRARIAARTRHLFAAGLVEETRELVARGRAEALRELRAVGYDEAVALIEGRLSRPEAEARTDLRTAQLAKRQRTWFRHQVRAIRIAADGRTPGEVAAAAREAIAGLGLG